MNFYASRAFAQQVLAISVYTQELHFAVIATRRLLIMIVVYVVGRQTRLGGRLVLIGEGQVGKLLNINDPELLHMAANASRIVE